MESVCRRSFLRGSAAGLLAASGCVNGRMEAKGSAFRTAISVSPFTEAVLAAGPLSDGQFTATDVPGVQRLFMRHGASEVYQRIACRKVSPQGHAEHGWARGLERAALARSLDLPFNPEIGVFANYGDVANYQESPDFSDYPGLAPDRRWTSLTIDEMVPLLFRYGAAVAGQIVQTGVTVNFWDVGNEAELGIAGVTPRPLSPTEHYEAPDAVDPAIARMEAKDLFALPERERIAWCRAHLWPHLARILKAVADGIRSVDRSARFSTHISSAFQTSPEFPVAFWDAMRAGGYLPDQLGQSMWGTQGKGHGGPDSTMAWTKDTASALRIRFGRPMFLAEFGFPRGNMPAPFDWNDDEPGYARDTQGQYAYIRDIAQWAAKTGNISGIRPWAPDYWIDAGWRNISFFQPAAHGAVAVPALSAIQDGVRTAAIAPVR